MFQSSVGLLGKEYAPRYSLLSIGEVKDVSQSYRAKRRMVSAVAAPEAPASSQFLKVHTASEMSPQDVKACIARPRVNFESILQTVPLHSSRPFKQNSP